MKKSQSALEFLLTYGWAFLIILVVIGALGYFGVLSPSKFLPQRCSINPGFSCVEYSANMISQTNAYLTIALRNDLGDEIVISKTSGINLAVDGVGMNFQASGGGLNTNQCTYTVGGKKFGFSDQYVVRKGETVYIQCQPGPTFLGTGVGIPLPARGSKLKYSYSFTYTPARKALSQVATGEVYVTLR